MTSMCNDGILAIDIGTTNLKCTLFDTSLKVQNTLTERLNILCQFDDCFEIEPNELLNSIVVSIRKILDLNESFRIKSFGISTQRNSFLLWDRNTGEQYTKFILWSDKRSKKICKKYNKSLLMNTVTNATKFASKIYKNHHIKLISSFSMDPTHVSSKLIDQLDILEKRLSSKDFKNVSFGTIETWLIWSLSKESLFVTDLSCVSSTGIYDIFEENWSTFLVYWFGIPRRILPSVKDTCDDFGVIKPSILKLDYEIPIRSIIGDSQASAIAECCFKPGECVITIGTGSFISVAIGDKPISSSNGNYPIAGFKFKDEKLYYLHSFVSTAGQSIDWAKSIGLFDEYFEIDQILEKTSDSGGVNYIPTLFELPEIDKNNMTSGFIGIKSDTNKSQMLRAVIESIAYLIKFKIDGFKDDLENNNMCLKNIKVSGGVTNSKKFCQLLSNLLEFPIEKSNFSDTSSVYGAAFLAGLSANMFQNLPDLEKYRQIKNTYYPDKEEIIKHCSYSFELKKWRKAMERLQLWSD